MPVADVVRAASAMRTALVGRPMVRFGAPRLVGPTPEAGRIIESVEVDGRDLQVVWDDGLVLDSHLKSRGRWCVYRTGQPWRYSHESLRASIETDEFAAVCFDAVEVETYRLPDRHRHPALGRPGPSIIRDRRHADEIVQLIMSYPVTAARVRDVVLDQHVMQGLGNVYRSELLWYLELSPWARVGDLTSDHVRTLVDVAVRLTTARRTRLAVYGRTGQGCERCRDTIESMSCRPYGQMLFWCPGCQLRLDRRQVPERAYMDPHPAAVKYLDELHDRRDRGRS